MFADYHLHTSYSRDSKYPMEEVVMDAIALGLDEICFTDHVDYGTNFDWHLGQEVLFNSKWNYPMTNVHYPNYVQELMSLKEKYKDQISIKLGLEFGIQQGTVKDFESLFAMYPFDFIILSIHQVDNLEFWNYEFQENKSQEEYNQAYYRELFEVIQRFDKYCVLGHLDMIARYDKHGHYPFEKIKPIITKILKWVIDNNKGIEVNTSSHRYGLEDLTPSVDILKLYKELGGTILTIGSDGHKVGDLGSQIEWTKGKLVELGFTHFCTYDRMNPIFHSLT